MDVPFETGYPIALPGIKKVKMQGNAAIYEIEPLEPGYGITIATALQRVLRSSLPGAAITALRIDDGVPGRGTRIPQGREFVSELILNLKQVRLRCFSDPPVLMHLEISGKREVSAADITVPDTIEIVNPDVHIAILKKEHSHLSLDLIARGYVPAEMQTEPSTGFIPIDAIYTPILNATYVLEHTRVGKMVNFDKIIFHIETDGTLHPDNAFTQSADILRRQFLVFTTYPPLRAEEEEVAAGSTFPIPQNLYHLPLENLHLPVRSNNSLMRSGITKVGQILSMNEDDLLGIRNIGETSIRDIALGLQATHCLPPFVQDDAQTQQRKEV